jgi:hypothetical protein
MAQAIHNPIRCPSTCESPPDPPIAIAQVRTGILDAIHEVNQVKTGVLLLGLNMDNGCHIDFRRFILEAIERKVASVENILDGIDGQPWECGR